MTKKKGGPPPLNEIERRMADLMLQDPEMGTKEAYLRARGLPIGPVDKVTSQKFGPARQRIASYLFVHKHPGELANRDRRKDTREANRAAADAAHDTAKHDAQRAVDAAPGVLLRRYPGPLDRTAADAMAEDLRLAAMEKGAIGVAVQALEIRAHLNGLSVKPGKEAAAPAHDTPADDNEDMDHAEFHRRIGPLLEEYRQITGDDLFPDRRGGEDGPRDKKPVL